MLAKTASVARTLLAVLFLSAVFVPAHAAEPTGVYVVKGTNPGSNQPYAGQVTVRRTGETFSVVWTIGDTTYTGIGILTGSTFSVSYYSAGHNGIAVYSVTESDNWSGSWAGNATRTLGRETWRRK